MRLKTLDIKGFKSFGDKVTIHFSEGVTAIVGPNGSGKSNVVDAMRWVLGEQKTRMLRSEKMENIIFNGTKSRKPANLAEVSLTFENTRNILPTEFSDVTITRKLYRSGESEYQLNNVTCRLKDITDLFLDTGIGSDSYSIIELRMIDEILNDRNDTIRQLFEEASGISKYKVRKKQTLNKLEETQADLERVNDLLAEIEKNMKTLESQAKKAEKYYKLREEYKTKSTDLALIQIESYKSSFEELQKQNVDQQDQKVALQNEIIKKEAGVEKAKLDSLNQEKELQQAQKFFNEKVAQIRQYENDKKIKDERLKFLLDKKQGLEAFMLQLKSEIEQNIETKNNIEVSKKAEQEACAAMEIEWTKLKLEVENIREKHNSAKIENETLNSRLLDQRNEMHRLEKEQVMLKARKDSLESEKNRLDDDSRKLEQNKTDLESLLVTAEKEFKVLQEAVAGLSKDLESGRSKILEQESILQKKNEELISVNRSLDARQNEFNLTKSLIDNLEGFPESIKFLKKNSEYKIEAPLLSDLISASSEYKLAIESFLEPYMNFFVVDTLDEAKLAINLLSRTAKGRANFFLLDEFKTEKFEPANPINGCVRAIDVVDYDPKYSTFFGYLLRNLLIAVEDEDKIPFSDSGDKNSVIVTRNGKFQRSRRVLTGGSVGLFDGKRIGRAKNLDTLGKEIKKLEISRLKLKSELEILHEESASIKKSNREKEDEFARKNSELNTASTRLASTQGRKEHLTELIRKNQARINDITLQLEQIFTGKPGDTDTPDESLGKLNSMLSELAEELKSKQTILSDFTEELNVKSQSLNLQHILFVQQQNKVNTLLRDLSFREEQQTNLDRSSKEKQVEYERVIDQVTEIGKTSDSSDDELTTMYEEKTNMELVVTEAETEYYKVRGGIEELENELKELRRNKESGDTISSAIQEKVTDLKIKLNSLKERLSVEFNIELEDLENQEQDEESAEQKKEIDEEKLRNDVEKMRQQMSNFGPINSMALEAYGEINERHTFINTQKEDLNNAKESLLATINEIDNTAKEKFLNSFEAIRENFIAVFRSLFSEEDKCDLVLVNPDSPLDSDIQITAQPKGKRPLSINQLSGGEKTLTATALLFGIYLLKPAPFCIFDEVDAPLDDNNIDKFNKIIKTFSTDSQFIIVTHNKRTMASTDLIYGITMIEQGITQVVPVDIREFA